VRRLPVLAVIAFTLSGCYVYYNTTLENMKTRKLIEKVRLCMKNLESKIRIHEPTQNCVGQYQGGIISFKTLNVGGWDT
jgi:hypothetical protein